MRWEHQPETDAYWESWKLYSESDRLVAMIVEKYRGFDLTDFIDVKVETFESLTLAKEAALVTAIQLRMEGKI